MSKNNDEIPLPNARAARAVPSARGGRAVAPRNGAPAGGARVHIGGGLNAQTQHMVESDPALETLRRRKLEKKGLNVQMDARIVNAFLEFSDVYGLQKGDLTGLALQEFLEHRGVVIPGLTKLPDPVDSDEETSDLEGQEASVGGGESTT
ncbi:hypothetical protein [Mycobacteroides abscessus]|uniref:hypothetical protein n=1 Tax=Mycobacteroides abscessus TaxID=36809 RepID=UPI0009C59F16|nr:hypothetical protein [Mycobacteroides abscessus]SLH40982.1 Uncharacterised protein [Mycobacteroides abscessus subsp. massiliense]